MDRRLRVFVIALLMGPGLVACSENQFNCEIQGNNVEGRIHFANGVPLESRTTILVQTSTDGFATAPEYTEHVDNLQGLISLPYDICADPGSVSVRAFQDTNGNGAYDAGEPAGRRDGTSSGHAAYSTFTIDPFDDQSEDAEWDTEEGVNFALDATTAP